MEKYLLELSGISKSFPGVKALDDVSFNLKAGEVHALLGENGAGKSTLMKIISGIYQRDSGSYRLEGREIDELTPKKAQELGIAIIHQELNMCTDLTVAENMFLGRESHARGVIRQREMDRQAAEILKKLKIDIDPRTVVKKLPVSKQQMVEIAKALSTNARILIMDEPTSALTDREIAELFRIVRDLRDHGCAIVYISHRLDELKEITDRVSIFRDGRYVATRNFAETTLDEIIAMMVGREIKEKFPHIPVAKGEKILEVSHLDSGMVKDVSFDLYAGEIIGLSGLMGAGRTELVRAIFGADPIENGTIKLDGEVIHVRHPLDAIEHGIVLGPEDLRRGDRIGVEPLTLDPPVGGVHENVGAGQGKREGGGQVQADPEPDQAAQPWTPTVQDRAVPDDKPDRPHDDADPQHGDDNPLRQRQPDLPPPGDGDEPWRQQAGTCGADIQRHRRGPQERDDDGRQAAHDNEFHGQGPVAGPRLFAEAAHPLDDHAHVVLRGGPRPGGRNYRSQCDQVTGECRTPR